MHMIFYICECWYQNWVSWTITCQTIRWSDACFDTEARQRKNDKNFHSEFVAIQVIYIIFVMYMKEYTYTYRSYCLI